MVPSLDASKVEAFLLLLGGRLGRKLLDLESRGKRLLELLGLLGVMEDEGVEVTRATDLELVRVQGLAGVLALGGGGRGRALDKSLLDARA